MAYETLELAKSFCSIESIQKAAYKLNQKITLTVKDDGKNHLVTISTIKDEDDLNHYSNLFKKYLNDEELRIKLKKETEHERNLILGIAFSQTKLVDDE
jgi:His-Xaa-Ser system protein HxsD